MGSETRQANRRPARQRRESIQAVVEEQPLLEKYHTFIYEFPVRAMGAPEDECGEFYVYAVEQIERRKILSGEKYSERVGTRFETWLSVVLRRLYIDLKRSQHLVAMDLLEKPEASCGTYQPPFPEESEVRDPVEIALASLKPEGRVLFKLLLLNDLFLEEDDLKVLMERSGHDRAMTIQLLRELEGQLTDRALQEQQRQEELTRVFWWVEHYRGKLARLLEIHGSDPATWNKAASATIAEARRKLAKRRRQHEQLVRQYRASGITVRASYDIIAKVLNTTRDAVKMEAYRCRRAFIQAIAPHLAVDDDA